ncbi:HAMP domain-containing sensor histidine kinase [uncultured Thomasclavelia sp.]|uniref:HAMP domain-containing sensor histidine kinase n=1 Tax=uncultured Thomasclavelia sp. TaxID=3025759 RepID=UPI0025D4885E|nr:HAMP domain-containing sensor histidine kinase [uncultured Thomasclavelia sp.]
MIKNWFNKLSVQISAIIIFFGTLAIGTFCLFYASRNYFFRFVLDLGIISDNVEAYSINIENQLIDQNVSINDVAKMDEILGTSEIYSVSIYNYDSNELITGSWATILDNLLIESTVFASETTYSIETYYRIIDLKDGTIKLYIDTYALAKTIMPYIIFSLIVSIIIFIVPTILFIKRKMELIINLKDEVTIMSQGDLEHQISVQGHDEIAELSKQIDNLRITLRDNFLTEETNRRANYDLVTALSHDLRTPLTSLRGYLEIIRLKKYKNDEQYNNYLNNSIDKVNQINELANKMFEYFLVFSKEQDSELTKISLGVIYEYIVENIMALEESGFKVSKEINYDDIYIHGNINLLKRIYNNIFSNISKYADNKEPIFIELVVNGDKKNIEFRAKNTKKHLINYIESNQIGLKSVGQMMKIHGGSLSIIDDKTTFTVILIFPIQS